MSSKELPSDRRMRGGEMPLNTLQASFFRNLMSFCWYNPQPMQKNYSITGTTILQTTLEDADNTQFYRWYEKSCGKVVIGL